MGAFDDLIPAGNAPQGAPAAPAPSDAGRFADLVPPSKAADVAMSTGSGLLRGVAEAAMTPVTLARMGASALLNGGERAVRWATGMGPVSPETQAARDQATQDAASRALVPDARTAQDNLRSGMDATLYAPQTTAGRYAQAVGEFLPGAAAGGEGLVQKGANILGYGVAPGLASEGLGEATQGTAAEPYARTLGALLAGGAGAAIRAPSVETQMLAKALGGATPADLTAAHGLMTDAASRGLQLTSPEAMQQVTNGATGLGRLQRIVEGVPEGAAVTAPIMAQRPGQVAGAVGQVLDRIAPPTMPARAGLDVQNAATGGLRDLEQYRTAETDPFYAVAGPVQVPQHAMTDMLGRMDNVIDADRTGVVAREVSNLRNMLVDQPATPGTPGTPATRTPVTGPNGQVIRYDTTSAQPGTPGTPEQPVTDIENLSRARRAMRERLDMPLAPGRDPITKEQAAAVGPFMDEMDRIMTTASPAYAQGNQVFGQISRDLVNPISAGPVGQMSGTGDILAQGRALLPDAPPEGMPAEAGRAVDILNDQNEAAAPTLVRHYLANRFAEATQDLQPGPNQYGGAKFAAQIGGNPIQRDTLAAALGALPNGSTVAPDVQRLSEALAATGKRQQPGSMTAYNAADLKQLGAPGFLSGAVQSAAKLNPTIVWQGTRDALDRARLGSRAETMARLLTAEPDTAIGTLAAARGSGADRYWGNALARALIAPPAGQEGQWRLP